MTLDQIEIMELIVEKGSFKAAAAHLRRTQPTLSIAIKKLEAEFNFQIFDRDAYRPVLTDKGRIFLHWAKPCLEAFRKLELIGSELGQQKDEVELTVGVDPLVRLDSLQLLLSSCMSQRKSTELVLRSIILDQGVEGVIAGNLHFAIAPVRIENQVLESVFFERIELLAVMNPNLAPTEDEVKKGNSWLRDRTQIIVESGSKRPEKPQGLGLLSGARRCYVSDHAMKRDLILKGYGWGRLARHEIEKELREGRLLKIDHGEVKSETLELFAIRNRERVLGPIARSFWGQLGTLATQKQKNDNI